MLLLLALNLKLGMACLGILICNKGRGTLCPCRCVLDTASLRSTDDDSLIGPTMDMGYGAEEYFVDCRLAREHTNWELVFVNPDSTTEE